MESYGALCLHPMWKSPHLFLSWPPPSSSFSSYAISLPSLSLSPMSSILFFDNDFSNSFWSSPDFFFSSFKSSIIVLLKNV